MATKEEMIACNSIAEEYKYIQETRCKCGGELELERQDLVFNDENTLGCHDVITCRCPKCNQPTEFAFDISSFFGKFTQQETDEWMDILLTVAEETK